MKIPLFFLPHINRSRKSEIAASLLLVGEQRSGNLGFARTSPPSLRASVVNLFSGGQSSTEMAHRNEPVDDYGDDYGLRV